MDTARQEITSTEGLSFLSPSDSSTHKGSRDLMSNELDEFFQDFKPNSADIVQRDKTKTRSAEDFLKFPRGESFHPCRDNIAELTDDFLETFTGQKRKNTKEYTMDMLLKTQELTSIEKSELGDSFLCTLTPKEILGLDEKANLSDIRSAYKNIVLKMHPDKNPDASERNAEMFRRITEAYEMLTKNSIE